MWFMGTAGGCVQANKKLKNLISTSTAGGADKKNFVMSGVANNGVSCTNCYVQLSDCQGYHQLDYRLYRPLLAYLEGAKKEHGY